MEQPIWQRSSSLYPYPLGVEFDQYFWNKKSTSILRIPTIRLWVMKIAPSWISSKLRVVKNSPNWIRPRLGAAEEKSTSIKCLFFVFSMYLKKKCMD
jgi:hypothetical protein